MNEFNPQVGDVIAFDVFPWQTERDRVVAPLTNPASTMLTGGWQIVWDNSMQAPRIVDDTFVMATFERQTDGWRRVS